MLSRRLSVLATGALVLAFGPVSASFVDNWKPQEAEVFGLINMQRAFAGLSPLVADDRLQASAGSHALDMSTNAFFGTIGSSGTTVTDRALSSGYELTSVGESLAVGQGRAVDFSTLTIFEIAPVDAARELMFGTADLTILSEFDEILLGGAGFSSWADVGSGWNDAAWALWDLARPGFSGWMGLVGDRERVLSPEFSDAGIGYVFGPEDTFRTGLPGQTYWTADFAAGDSLAAVPIPPTVWLLGMGLCAIGISCRRPGLSYPNPEDPA